MSEDNDQADGGQATTLYRLFAESGELLYVGISDRWLSRLKEHARMQPWWDEVVGVERETHPTRAAALVAERKAIQTEDPVYNTIRHTPLPPLPLMTTLQQRLMAFASSSFPERPPDAPQEDWDMICRSIVGLGQAIHVWEAEDRAVEEAKRVKR